MDNVEKKTDVAVELGVAEIIRGDSPRSSRSASARAA